MRIQAAAERGFQTREGRWPSAGCCWVRSMIIDPSMARTIVDAPRRPTSHAASGHRRNTHLRITGIIVSTALIVLTSVALAQAPGVDGMVAPIYGVKIPAGYREWPLISVARVGAPITDMRAKLANDIAVRAFREGIVPFPDGTIIARLAWSQATSDENNTAVRGVLERSLSPEAVQKLLAESFVAGPPTNVQFMVKDSIRYASTGGWGFAQFTGGKADGEPVHQTCFGCHAPAKERDYVFTRYSR